jgi:transposase
MEAAMRGSDAVSGALFSYVDLEDRVPAKHPLRLIREVVNEVLAALDADFSAMYAAFGRPSIAPERLLRGSLIQAFYTIRSERQLMEQLDYNLLFRWFVGLGIDDPVWDHSTYSKNRDRLLEADVAKKFLTAILAHAKVKPLLSDDHFTVDGTLVQAWASMKSFVPREQAATDDHPSGGDLGTGTANAEPGAAPPDVATGSTKDDEADDKTKTQDTKDQPAPTLPEDATMPASANAVDTKSRNAEVDFHGQKRSNATHVSATDPEARLYKKGKGAAAKLCFIGHAMTENRHGLVVETEMTQATGTAERAAAIVMINANDPGSERRITVGADKGYDTADFVADLRAMNVTPHVAQNDKGRRSAIDARTTRHKGYAVSQKKRKLVEEPFGWGKVIGGLSRPMRRGTAHIGYAFTFVMAAYDLVRLPKLLGGYTNALAGGATA